MPRRASIANFGVGGSNTHAILECPRSFFGSREDENGSIHGAIIGRTKRNGIHQRNNGSLIGICEESQDKILDTGGHTMGAETVKSKYLFAITNKGRQGLEAYLDKALPQYLQKAEPDTDVQNLAYTLTERRTHFSSRVSFVADSVDQILQELQNARSAIKRTPATMKKPEIGFVFTGQGAQWARMGYELIDAYPAFAKCVDEADLHLAALGASWRVRGKSLVGCGGHDLRLTLPQMNYPNPRWLANLINPT